MKHGLIACVLGCLLWAQCGTLAIADPWTLPADSHVCLLGNTLAERFQHDGYFETMLHLSVPHSNLVIRNLGFSGDELSLRLRSSGFGSPDDHLRHSQANVILAFFGYNESFAGSAGLATFRSQLAQEISHWRAQAYAERGAPSIVLFSPIAVEGDVSPDLPSATETNAQLQTYVAAMQAVAAEQQVVFVDLFTPTLAAYAREASPLTINGVHLNSAGNRIVAQIVQQAIFPTAQPIVWEDPQVEKIRQAVIDKSEIWFQRYRTTDGFSIYGGRADLTFVNGQTNRVVMDREMAILDQMTALRDRRIAGLIAGRDEPVDDRSTEPFIPVITNKPGEGPNGAHLFLSGSASLEKMTVATGMKVELFASEEMFPELINPVQMAFDTRGRLWVATWSTYPHWKPKDPMDDRLLILEDTDHDGRADKCTTFASGLHNPTGFEFYGRGVYVAMVPDLLYLEDQDGDDRADVRERVVHGIDSADTHHSINSFVLDPGGALYFQEGTFHHTQVETPHGSPVRSANAGVFRWEPRTHRFEVYVAYGFANPHGHVFDRWGQDFIHDGTGAVPYHGALFSGHLNFPAKHQGPPTLYPQRTRPCPATELVSADHFPPEMQGNLLVGNVIGFQGVLQYRLKDRGASFIGEEVEPILSSTDPNFRPTDLEIAPDGSLYISDWQNPIIGHMQHNLRDPSRDRVHGRVYRVTYPSRPLSTSPKVDGASVGELVALLAHPHDRVRYRAKIELAGRNTHDVIQAARAWLAERKPADADYEHQVLEGLWLHQYHHVVDRELLGRVLASSDERARAAAVRVLCAWRDEVPDTLDLLKRMATDSSARVRLEAIRAASFLRDAAAIEIVLLSMEHPTDEYLDYVRNETMRTLDPIWKQAINEGQPIAVTSEVGIRWLLERVSIDELLKFPKSPAVFQQWLAREGVRDEFRQEALRELAASRSSSPLDVLLATISDLDGHAERLSTLSDLGRLLASWNSTELMQRREQLERLATQAKSADVRRMGFVGLIMADRHVGRVWHTAEQSIATLRDVIGAMPLVPDLTLQDQLFQRIEPLLHELPQPWLGRTGTAAEAKGWGRYVRIELSGNHRTLTLAEVQVLSDGQNVAQRGTASQSATAHGGDAQRAIDGRTDGSYASGTQTHTPEDQPNPWWELDLGEELPFETIAIFNRTDGDLGERLAGYSLQVLDGQRQKVWETRDQPTPNPVSHHGVEIGSAADRVRHAVMQAVPYVRGHEARMFTHLATRTSDPRDRSVALQSLLRIPRRAWPQDQIDPLLRYLMEYARSLPTEQRGFGAGADALQLADALVASMPNDQAKQLRRELRELGILKLRLGTVPHRMAYDLDRLVVPAGKSIEIDFENQDIMPHNLVITRPGALEEIGLLAEAGAQQAGAVQRHYVPASDKILLASHLLQPRQAQRLQFQTPDQPGVYPFVCTYPGHWRRMFGSLYVVADLERFESEGEAYLTEQQIAPQDELLKMIRPSQQWKLSDLSPALSDWQHGRSFAAGRRMFQLSSCVACHRMNGEGNEIGPDLTKLDAKLTPLEILQQMVEPSAQINKDFQSYVLELKSGQVVTGLIQAEVNGSLRVLENPLASTEARTIALTDIEQRERSTKSIMPEGLLDRLTRDEILDLLAYVYARGVETHAVFQGEGHEHHASP